MLCTGCGTQAAVIGRFCSLCDTRARNGTFERRRPVGGAQWQALWGIRYAGMPAEAKRRRSWQRGATVAVVVLAVVLAF
jgi:hypothetical protein